MATVGCGAGLWRFRPFERCSTGVAGFVVCVYGRGRLRPCAAFCVGLCVVVFRVWAWESPGGGGSSAGAVWVAVCLGWHDAVGYGRSGR